MLNKEPRLNMNMSRFFAWFWPGWRNDLQTTRARVSPIKSEQRASLQEFAIKTIKKYLRWQSYKAVSDRSDAVLKIRWQSFDCQKSVSDLQQRQAIILGHYHKYPALIFRPRSPSMGVVKTARLGQFLYDPGERLRPNLDSDWWWSSNPRLWIGCWDSHCLGQLLCETRRGSCHYKPEQQSRRDIRKTRLGNEHCSFSEDQLKWLTLAKKC